MTGRELIMYILENHLEDEPVFQNGMFIGYASDVKFAEMLGVGRATIRAWVSLGYVKGAILVGDTMYIPIKCNIDATSNELKTKGAITHAK